jgi:hypothetical protein
VDAFSRRYQGWLVPLAVQQQGSDRRYLARDVPLRGIVSESIPGTRPMIVFTGEIDPHVAHFVGRPVALAVDENADCAEAELSITNDVGAQTIIEIRSPTRPELVDGTR